MSESAFTIPYAAMKRIVVKDGCEFFPMCEKTFNEVFARYADMATRAYKRDHAGRPGARTGSIPEVVISMVTQKHGTSHVFDKGAERRVWWEEAISGKRFLKFVSVGPLGPPGVWIGGLT